MNNLIKTAGRAGNAGSMYFDGIDDYVQFNDITVPIHNFSISFFVKNIANYVSIGNYSGYAIVIGRMGDKYRSYIGINSTKYIRAETMLNQEHSIFDNVGLLPFEKYNHICFVYNEGQVFTYINSNLINVNTITTLTILNTLGGTTSDTKFNGYLQDLKTYDRPLHQNEVKLLSQGLPISRSGLVGEWKLNEMSGTTAYDTSGQGNHGTIVGATYSTDKPF